MFNHNPELKDVFNMSHQENGANNGPSSQQEALFNAICAYANNIENLTVLLPAVETIAHKHTSFMITAEQYNIVGSHLIATIDELLAPDKLDAWAETYDCWQIFSSIVKKKSIKKMRIKSVDGVAP